MSAGDPRGTFLYKLPSSVLWDFCRVMDGLSDLDWTRFASEVLGDQTAVRLAERRERRTDWVMNRLENRNRRVGELIDLLERLQLLRPRDVILGWASSLKPPSPPPAPPPPAAPAPAAPPVCLSQFDPPSKPNALPTPNTYNLSTTVDKGPLPRPAPPPLSLHSDFNQPRQPAPVVSGVMCWSYEEVHAGTEGFSPSLQVGEGGFGVVYKATLRNTDCAVKRLKQDCLVDWALLKESFQTEVEKLTKMTVLRPPVLERLYSQVQLAKSELPSSFRHPNIVDLLGVSEGGGTVCLIYSYMDKRSLEDQLHNVAMTLSWSQRVAVVEEASKALQFLHCPPGGETPLIHGDVKSSNILLDRHLVVKLADFGLARSVSRGPSGRSASQTVSVGKTTTVRGTLAYLPDEYVRDGKLGTAVDVFSFGVVLLEVLTGRRALEKNNKSGGRFLKDLVDEVEDNRTASSAAAWRKQLDHRLTTGGAAEPVGCMEMVDLACKCLDKNRKKRPAMTEVFDKLQGIHNTVKKASSSSPLCHPAHPHLQPPSHSFPRLPHPLDSCVGALSQQLSKLGPLEDTYQPSQFSSSSSFCSLTPPHPLHSSSSLPPTSSSLPTISSSLPPSSSFAGPCETDESRGFSQYDLYSQFKSKGTSSRSLSPSIRDQYDRPIGPENSQFSQPSVPTEDQYNPPPQPSSSSDRSGARALTGPDIRGQTTAGATAGLCGAPESVSPVQSLRSLSLGPSAKKCFAGERSRHAARGSSPQFYLCPVHVNPSKQRFLQKKTLYEEGRIQTPELLSSDDLYGGRSSVEVRGPEESDELDYLPTEHD